MKQRLDPSPAPSGLPRVKTTGHVRLVGSWGQFVPPTRDGVTVRGIELSADGRLAVLGLRGSSPGGSGAAVHRVDTGERLRHLGDEHGAVAITPDGALVFTTRVGWEDRQVQIGTCWDVATGAARWTRTLQSGDGIPGLAISPAGELLISSQGHGIKAYDLDGELLWEDKIAKGLFDNHAAAIAFSPGGALTTAGADGVIRIWSGKKVARTIREANAIADLAWLPGGARLLSHSSHLTAIWDVATGKPVKKLREWERGRLAGEIVVSPVGLIVGCTTDGKIDLWDLDGAPVDRIDLKGKVGAWCVAACPGGVVVGTGGACALRFELTP